jgi:hypothetical protein
VERAQPDPAHPATLKGHVLGDDILNTNTVEDLSFDLLEIVQLNTIPFEAERSPRGERTNRVGDRQSVSQPREN